MPEQIAGFSEELLAPCGINCALCSHHLAYVIQAGGAHRMVECSGCRPSSKQCACKKTCGLVGRREVRYCFECASFPCRWLKRLDLRYSQKYSYNPIATLKAIRLRGTGPVLAGQREHYRCPRCGGVICIHNGKCYTCDKVKSWRG